MISYFYSTHLCLYKIINKLLKPIEAHICEEDNPCLNGGTCQSSGSTFVCVCPSFYSGAYCQTCKSKQMNMLNSNTLFIVYYI